MIHYLAALVLGAGPGVSAKTPTEASSARVFLEQVYAGYRSGGSGAAARDRRSIYSPATAALMARVEAADGNEMMGAVEADPICACQDFDELVVEKIVIRAAKGPVVRALVTFRDRGFGTAPTTLRYELLKTPVGWRVHDVSLPGQGMLRGVLTATPAAGAATFVPNADSDVRVPRVRLAGSPWAEQRINRVLDEVRLTALRERAQCLGEAPKGRAEYNFKASPTYNRAGKLSFRMEGFAFCGGANGTFLQGARSFDTANGGEIDALAGSGMSRAALEALGRGYYRGEPACYDALQSEQENATLAHGFLAEEGLGLLYAFSSGAAESCGAEPAVIPWNKLKPH